MSFYLVQRLSHAHEGNTKPGFDHHFSLEYMGSSEFEFGEPNAALKRMREKPLVVFHHEVSSCAGKLLPEAKPVFFVAPKDGLLDKITEFESWLSDRRPRAKEATYLPEHLTGVDFLDRPISDYHTRTVAWWSFSDDIAWALDPDVAAKLHLAFQPKSP